MWIASGMSYAALCDHLVDAALERREIASGLSVR
jgi:heme exporter protein D